MNTLKLRNGAEEAEPLVRTVMGTLKQLWSQGIPGVLLVSNLVQICKNDPTYKKFGSNEEKLKKLALLQADGRPHDSIRNVVLSAFKGSGLDLEFLGSATA